MASTASPLAKRGSLEDTTVPERSMPPMQDGAAQDAALAGGGQRVLVVHVGIGDADHDLPRIELVERAVDELRADLPIRLREPERLEADSPLPLLRSLRRYPSTASRAACSRRGRTPRCGCPPYRALPAGLRPRRRA